MGINSYLKLIFSKSIDLKGLKERPPEKLIDLIEERLLKEGTGLIRTIDRFGLNQTKRS